MSTSFLHSVFTSPLSIQPQVFTTIKMERDFDLVDHEETQRVNVIDLDAQNPRIVIDMIIKKQEDKIQYLSVNLERDKWIMRERYGLKG